MPIELIKPLTERLKDSHFPTSSRSSSNGIKITNENDEIDVLPNMTRPYDRAIKVFEDRASIYKAGPSMPQRDKSPI